MLKFIAADEAAAKTKASRALGASFHVISMRRLPSGDVELTASDQPAPARPAEPAPARFADHARRSVDDPAPHRPTGARLHEPLEQKFSEAALQRLSGELSGAARVGRGGPDLSDRTAAGMAELLKPHGISDELLAALIEGARRSRIDDDYYRLEQAFAHAFDFAPMRASETTPIMLIGPTGAGKTSCSAKLAAAAMRRDGFAFMMTADVGRAGAIDQIRTYGETLGADYHIVESPLDVAQTLRARRPQGAVILDTPGVSPYDSADLAALRSFQDAAMAEPVLVLPASGDAAEYRDWALAFRDYGVRRMIVTKFDATRRVGAALSAAFDGRMTLAYFSETPFISEGLVDASPEFLARRLASARAGRVA